MKTSQIILFAGTLIVMLLSSCREAEDHLEPIQIESASMGPGDTDMEPKDPPKDPPKDRDNWRQQINNVGLSHAE
ncbi:hypothetical protein P0M11_02170 [Kaistella sp. PBT33-4]|uniref:hypothetical protein n=1 Tax=Kaistella sp. PBT33-4 TaxID=3032000 RepID=UPI0023D8456C|nr:hypothetical protein [Kaistella sp. PBT33-4]MDF0718796.1 hypothetical protein [Kaistella sp. PBT33-4]